MYRPFSLGYEAETVIIAVVMLPTNGFKFQLPNPGWVLWGRISTLPPFGWVMWQ